ncbi:MAG: hypothetical protein ACRDRY_18560 [Pseudonocardiaceae bacterium]
MKITMTTGTRYLLQIGPHAAPRELWSEQVLTVPSGVCRLRAGRLAHGAFRGAPANPIGIDLPGTDRMRRSASEP